MREPAKPYQHRDSRHLSEPARQPRRGQPPFKAPGGFRSGDASHARHLAKGKAQFVTDPEIGDDAHGSTDVAAKMGLDLDAAPHGQAILDIGLQVGFGDRVNGMTHSILLRS
jgi:hypothetical protein